MRSVIFGNAQATAARGLQVLGWHSATVASSRPPPYRTPPLRPTHRLPQTAATPMSSGFGFGGEGEGTPGPCGVRRDTRPTAQGRRGCSGAPADRGRACGDDHRWREGDSAVSRTIVRTSWRDGRGAGPHERVGNVGVRTSLKHKMVIVGAFQGSRCRRGDDWRRRWRILMCRWARAGRTSRRNLRTSSLWTTDLAPSCRSSKESRYSNIQNFLSFQPSIAAAALMLITLGTIFGMQILFSILMDGPPSQLLGFDHIDHDVMRQPPRKKDEPITSRYILSRVAFSASVVVGTLLVYYFALSDD
ncbi:hypothetical protein BJY52DRAFT_524238 [Lactarius psammicola]|nr:hypothetical protein BJY52DRAFT_524238 [Lactarius psammicola]